MDLGISFFAGLLAFLAYAAFAIVLSLRGKQSWSNYRFVFAAGVTALWALSVAAADRGWSGETLRRVADVLRNAGWFVVIIGLLQQDSEHAPLWRRLALAASLLIALDLAFAVFGFGFDTGLGLRVNLTSVQLAVSVTGLILIENLMRNLPPQRIWSVKLLAIGLTALYGYEIVLRIPVFLGGDPLEVFAAAQPLMYLVALPLFVVTAIRSDSLRLHIHSSRNVIFHSATLIFAGILLQGTAAAALYVRHFGGAPAVTLSIVLGFAGLVGVVVAAGSQMVRSQIRTFINENFFSYKYDYRREWTKFIQALSQYEEHGAPERVLRTLADLLDSPGGVLWVRRSGWRQFVPLSHWSFGENFGPIEPNDPLLAAFADDKTALVALRSDEDVPGAALWRERFPDAWIAVPLRFRDGLMGFALLRKPRAHRRLDWEDRSLVALIAMQLAAHLVHEHTAQALADTQQLAEFNNRVTFALHDLKNMAGQLGLLAHNAERFGDDARFRADMMETLRHAVENLQKLIAKLRGEDAAAADVRAADGRAARHIDVRDLVSRFAQRRPRPGVRLAEADAAGPVYASLAKPDAFETVLEHIVANAVEACTGEPSVRLSVERAGERVRVRVADNGVGMTAEFIAHELFRPLHTTKKKGLGIGAYQARSIMRDIGGDIEVESTPGRGTTVSLLLPACQQTESSALP